MKKISVKRAAVCLALCLAVITVTDLFLPMGEEKVYDSVIRLHVLANSDSPEDQSVKLAVRDAILDAGIFEDAGTKEEAERGMESAARLAAETANKYLKENGLPYTADFLWGYESYPTREYEGIRLPAGRYLSLRVVLGKGEGRNWWCVLFPPLCTGAASKKLTGDKADAVFDVGKTRYKFRFKLLEWLFS